MRRFERPLLTVILRLVDDPVVAEDIAQESFVKAFRNLARYDPQRKLASWLFKIAHNTALDHLRRRGRAPATVPLEAENEAGESWETLPAPAEERPDRVAGRGELVRGIETALAGLRPEYREVLLLRFQEDLSYHEIAEVTGLPMGTVKVQIHRARKQLAAALAAAGLDAPERWTP